MAGDERILDEALSSGDPKLIEKSIHLAVAFRQAGIYEKLADVYAGSSDRGVKSAIIESYMIGRNIDSLAEILENETDTVLMEKIIEMLAVSRSQKASGVLRDKYAELSDNKLKAKILEGFMIQGDAKQLVSVFRNESDPKLKRKAVELLSVMRNAEAQEFMLSLLEDDSDA